MNAIFRVPRSRALALASALVAAMCVWALGAAPAWADLTLPATDNFETDPFGGGRWTAVGNAEWSTEQSLSSSHSIKLFNSEGWQYFNNRAFTYVNDVPQDDALVEVSWNTRYSTLPGENQHYLMTFGYDNNPANGIGDLLVVWVLHSSKNVGTSDGAGHLRATSFNMPADKWVKFRVVFDQNLRTYDLYVQPEGEGETQLRDDTELVGGTAKFGDDTHKGLVSAASIDCQYYIDDVSVSSEENIGPEPTPTPSPFTYPGTDNFSGEPLSGGANGRWFVSGLSDITVSNAEYRSPSQSIRLQGPDAGYGDAPRLTAKLEDVPQSGEVQVELYTFFESHDPSNACQFINFGSSVTQGGTGYQTLVIGWLTGEARTLMVNDSLGWHSGDPAIEVPLNTWIRHRIVFDQSPRFYSYYVKIGDGEEVLYIADEITSGKRLGEESAPYFSSLPFCNNVYYLDDFRITEPGEEEPPVNRARPSWVLY